MATLVAVDDLRASVTLDGLLQHCHAPWCGHRVAHAPADHIPGVHVDDGEQVHVAPSHRDVADVELPDPVPVVYLEILQQIRILVGLLIGKGRAPLRSDERRTSCSLLSMSVFPVMLPWRLSP